MRVMCSHERVHRGRALRFRHGLCRCGRHVRRGHAFRVCHRCGRHDCVLRKRDALPEFKERGCVLF